MANLDNSVQTPLIRLAIPKKGRLYSKIVDLLEGSGFQYYRSSRNDIANCVNFPMQLVFLPASDIATFVGQGDIDLGITGQDIVAENEEDVKELLPLGFGKCKVCVLGPVAKNYGNSNALLDKRICTSFTAITRNYFKNLAKDSEKNVPKIKYVSGSVEATCNLGLADGVVDIVESGTTMRACGLEILDIIMRSQAVLIGNKNLIKTHAELVNCIKRRIEGYMTSQQYKLLYYNINKQDLSKAKTITPGKRAPTISPLDENDWVAVSVMVLKEDAANIMDKLHHIGARDIFTVALDNFR